MLLQLPPLSQVPGAHSVVQATRPEFSAIVRDVNAAGTICVALELPTIPTRQVGGQRHRQLHFSNTSHAYHLLSDLPDKRLIMEVPDGNVAIATTGEADLSIRADGQSVAGRG